MRSFDFLMGKGNRLRMPFSSAPKSQTVGSGPTRMTPKMKNKSMVMRGLRALGAPAVS